MEDVGLFYGHSVHFTSIWYILWPLGIHILWLFGTFPPFWYVVPRKIWQPCSVRLSRNLSKRDERTVYQTSLWKSGVTRLGEFSPIG
jgi:hypothetical protein